MYAVLITCLKHKHRQSLSYSPAKGKAQPIPAARAEGSRKISLTDKLRMNSVKQPNPSPIILKKLEWQETLYAILLSLKKVLLVLQEQFERHPPP